MGSSGDSAITMQFADVLHNMSSTVLLSWQQTAFQTFPDILGFSGHLMALINVNFQAKNHCIIEIGLEGTGKD